MSSNPRQGDALLGSEARTRAGQKEIRCRAEKIRTAVPALEIVEGRSLAGGGSTPEQSLPTWLIVVPGDAVALERSLRANDPPIIARIEGDRVVLDLRTVLPEEDDVVARVLAWEMLWNE